ncbi:MAG: sensor histidine kinase [Marinoscillum sp.]
MILFLSGRLVLAQEESPFVSMGDQNLESVESVVDDLLVQIMVAEKEGDISTMIQLNNQLIIRYALMKNLDRAGEIGLRNLKRAKAYGDSCLLGQTYNHFGIYLGNRKEYDRAHNTPGEVFFKWADSAIYYFKKSISTVPGDSCILNPVGWGYAGLMRQYYFKARMGHRNFDTAFYYAERAESNAIMTGDKELLQARHVWTARSYSQLGENQLAKQHITKAYELAKSRQGGFHEIYDVWFGVLAKESGNDSILWLHSEILERSRYQAGQEMQSAIQEADKKYETDRKEADLQLKQEKLDLQDNVIRAIALAAFLVVLLSLYLFYLYRKNRKLSVRNEHLLKEQNHRVKNNLQMISSLLSLQSQKLLSADAKNALNNSQLRVNSVALLHRMLYEGDHIGKINLSEYISTLVEEIRFSAHRTILANLDIEENLSLKIEQSTSLGLIVNELITNSAKHIPTEVHIEIQLSIKREAGKLSLSYQDNGPGVDPEVWKRSESFGNQLIRIQSDQLNGQYQVSYTNGFHYLLKMSG